MTHRKKRRQSKRLVREEPFNLREYAALVTMSLLTWLGTKILFAAGRIG